MTNSNICLRRKSYRWLSVLSAVSSGWYYCLTGILIRSSLPEVFLETGVLKICSKFTGKHPYRSVISIKLLFTLRHRCSPVNLQYIFKTPKNTSGRLLLIYGYCKSAKSMLHDIYRNIHWTGNHILRKSKTRIYWVTTKRSQTYLHLCRMNSTVKWWKWKCLYCKSLEFI